MPRQIYYNAAESIARETAADPYLRPSFPLSQQLRRVAWNLCWLLLYRPSPRPLHGWRSFLLRFFGAQMGPDCHFYPSSKVWAPWNLVCGDVVALADGAEIYNPWTVTLGSHSTISQQAYVCTASHDVDDPAFPMVGAPVTIGDHAWICARAAVLPGVSLGPGAVLALGSIATHDLAQWTLYAGAPARPMRERKRHA